MTEQGFANPNEVFLLTPWTPIETSDPSMAEIHDAEKDEAFRLLVATAMLQALGDDMTRQLLAAGVDLVAVPGKFFVIFREDPDTWHFVPEVSELLTPFTPWREEGETAH